MPSWYALLTEEERKEENGTRAARRAKAQVRRLVRHFNARRLLTFTNGGEGDGWRSARQARREFLAWALADGSPLLPSGGMVVVAERGGKIGRWHIHVGCAMGYIDYGQVYSSWSAHLNGLGYESTTGGHRWHAGDDSGKHARGFASARVCGNYLAGYIGKDLAQTGDNEKRYQTIGAAAPEPGRVYPGSIADARAMVLENYGDGVKLTPFYDNDDVLAGYWFDYEPLPSEPPRSGSGQARGNRGEL